MFWTSLLGICGSELVMSEFRILSYSYVSIFRPILFPIFSKLLSSKMMTRFVLVHDYFICSVSQLTPLNQRIVVFLFLNKKVIERLTSFLHVSIIWGSPDISIPVFPIYYYWVSFIILCLHFYECFTV